MRMPTDVIPNRITQSHSEKRRFPDGLRHLTPPYTFLEHPIFRGHKMYLTSDLHIANGAPKYISLQADLRNKSLQQGDR
jgi:hypothetical protein